jgi:hypothetical protein
LIPNKLLRIFVDVFRNKKLFGRELGLRNIELVKNCVEATDMSEKVVVTQLTQHQLESFVVLQPIPVIVDNRKHVVW